MFGRSDSFLDTDVPHRLARSGFMSFRPGGSLCPLCSRLLARSKAVMFLVSGSLRKPDVPFGWLANAFCCSGPGSLQLLAVPIVWLACAGVMFRGDGSLIFSDVLLF